MKVAGWRPSDEEVVEHFFFESSFEYLKPNHGLCRLGL